MALCFSSQDMNRLFEGILLIGHKKVNLTKMLLSKFYFNLEKFSYLDCLEN